MERFEEYLQSRSKRMTRQRRLIVDHVFREHHHFDADDLLDHLKQTLGERKVSRPTVYRTLSELVDAGLLIKMELGGRAVYDYDYGYPSHEHLFCQKCKKLIEFHSDEIDRICDAAGREHSFRVLNHRMIVSGVCQECSQSKRRRKSRLDLI